MNENFHNCRMIHRQARTAKPKRVMTFGNCLFKLRDVKIKQQLLCSAIIIKSDYLFCHDNAKNTLCKLKTIPL